MGVNWLLEMEDYNEFMAEEDYEVDETGETQANELSMSYDEFAASEEKPKKKPSKKRGRSPSPTQTPKGGRKAKASGGRSVSKKARTAAAAAAEEEEEEDLTADMEDPPPENNISEVKYTAANAGRADMQVSKPGGSTLMDLDEASESQEAGGAGDAVTGQDKDENEDNVTEQTHHIIVPSYR